MKTEEFKLVAVRVHEWDMVGDKHYGDNPYGVVLDWYDMNGDFVESGTDWSYFATEEEVNKYVNEYNKNK